MSIRIDLDTEKLDKLIHDLPTKGDDLVQKAAEDIVAFAQVSMVGGGSPHVPSAPGEPPHREFSTLANSIRVHPKEKDLERDVGDAVEYGIHLELGAPKSGLAARPWLIPATVKEKRPFEEAWRQFFERA